ncbi:MAG: hypothetical protein IJ693_03600 [Bacteroidaceae bacterium]|nr:hypothetical protein [Bacteroidaceae bacterium]
MKKLKLLLTLMVLCTTTIVWADDVKIPTTEGEPLRLDEGCGHQRRHPPALHQQRLGVDA